MGVVSLLTAPLRFCFGTISWITDSWLLLIASTILIIMSLMTTAVSVLVVMEEVLILLLIIPWLPTYWIGLTFSFFQRLGLPTRIACVFYIAYILVLVAMDLIALELRYLEVGEQLQTSFAEFRGNLFTSLKLFVVVHRLLTLLSNEATLKRKYQALKKRLVQQEGEDSDEDSEGTEEGRTEVEKLKERLEKTKRELEVVREAFAQLQQHENSRRSSHSGFDEPVDLTSD